MCSLGLGAKRRAKPPSQRRDIRPPQKLLRVGSSLLPFTSVSTAPNPPAVPHSTPQENQKEESPSSSAPNNATHISPNHLFTDSTPGTVHHSSIPIPSTSTSAFRPVIPTAEHTTSSSAPVDPLTNLYTIANACVSTDARLDDTTLSGKESHTNAEMSIGSEVMISDSSGLQIFTTINEPCEPDERGSNGCPTVLSACDDNSEATSVSSDEDDDQYVVQLSSPAHDATTSEPSIYQLLFQLPSVPNTSLCGAVVCAVNMIVVVSSVRSTWSVRSTCTHESQ